MKAYSTFVGVDLGGARGKTTAVATLRKADDGMAIVADVAARHRGQPWTDDVLLDFVGDKGSDTVLAIDAPLTEPSCVRCTKSTCPGQRACTVPSVVWLREKGRELYEAAIARSDRIAAIPSQTGFATSATSDADPRIPMAPYTHRCTEVLLHFEEDLLGRDLVGQGPGPLSARAGHLRRVLAERGYRLNDNLIEVSPRATVSALFGEEKSRWYKRDADPWLTRASIIEGLQESLRFGPRSGLSREEVLRNDHCFDALLSAYTAYLYATGDWQMPDDELFQGDGWIWAPPKA